MEPTDLQSTVIAQQARIRELENEGRKTAIATALGGALDAAGLPLHVGAREHLGKLMGDQLGLAPDGKGGNVVVAPGGQAVNEWVKTQLTSGGYTNFVRSGAPGPQGGGQSAPAAEPRNMGEAIAARMAGVGKPVQGGHMTGGSRLDESGNIIREPAAGFGLRRKGS